MELLRRLNFAFHDFMKQSRGSLVVLWVPGFRRESLRARCFTSSNAAGKRKSARASIGGDSQRTLQAKVMQTWKRYLLRTLSRREI